MIQIFIYIFLAGFTPSKENSHQNSKANIELTKKITSIVDSSKLKKKTLEKTLEKTEEQAAGCGNPQEDLLLPKDLLAPKRDSLVQFASKFLGTPYRWGGTQPGGFDCSGFALYIYKKFGYQLPRISGSQVALGREIDPKEAKPGDLAYYGYRGYYSHTAMVYDIHPKYGVRVIHATLWGVAITALHFDPYSGHRLLNLKRIIE
jgi:cell wall-associated NlpC family hydrolase